MSEIITKGYLINKQDFETFDEIITFINEYGNKFTCIAKGTKKITSKNARSLRVGNFCEFQFFLARNENKVSKLMKVNVIDAVKWPIYRQSLVLLNNLAEQLIYPDIKNYKFYKKMIPLAVDENIDDKKVQLIILRNYCRITGIELHTNSCVVCHNHHIKTVSFEKKGLLCGQCAAMESNPFDLDFTKLTYHLFKDQYEKMDKYSYYYIELIKHLKKYIVDNNGTYFYKIKRSLAHNRKY